MDFVGDVGEAALVALVTLLGARRLLACTPHRLERCAGAAVGFGECILALRETIGGGAASRFRRLDLADQYGTLVGENARSIFQAGALGLRFLCAGGQGLDLRGGAFMALAPALAIGGDRGEPPRSDLAFARESLGLRARLGELGALLLDCSAQLRELRFDLLCR